MRAAVSLLTLVCFAPVAAGCLSHQYAIPKDELGRLAETPPETRGAHVRVVQQIGSRRGEPIPYRQTSDLEWTPPQPANPEPLPPPPEDPPPPHDPVMSTDGYVGIRIDASPQGGTRANTPGNWRGRQATTGSGWRGGHASAGWQGAPASGGGGGWHGSPSSGGGSGWHGSPSSGGGGGWRGSSSSGGGGGGLHLPSGGGDGGGKGGEALVVIAVIAVIIVAVAAVGLIGAEGMRFDGYAKMSPAQPVHLKRDGGEIVMALGDLTPASIAGVDEALVMDDEGYGFRRLEHKLERKGFAFKLDAGTVAFGDGASGTVVGPTAHFQVGGFFTNSFGAFVTGEVGGANDKFGATLSRHSVGVELQGLWLNRGPFHLGNYLNGGRAFSAKSGDDVVQQGPRVGGGLLAEIDLTGRMALMLRAGGSVARTDAWSSDGVATIGLAIY